MRGLACPVTEISDFATEISIAGMKIFPYEHSSPVTGTKLFKQNGFISKVTRVQKAKTVANNTSLCSTILVVFLEFHPSQPG